MFFLSGWECCCVCATVWVEMEMESTNPTYPMLVFNPHWPLCIPIQVWCGAYVYLSDEFGPGLQGEAKAPCWGCGALGTTPPPLPLQPCTCHIVECHLSSSISPVLKWNSWTALFFSRGLWANTREGILERFQAELESSPTQVWDFCVLFYHLPPLRFHCVEGCWDWTQDCFDIASAVKRSNH